GFCIRDKRLGTQRTEFGVGKLGPHYTVPTPYRRMIYFDAALVTFIAEGRSDFIVFHFVMLVIGVAGANANFMYARKRLQVFTAQVDPLTFQINDRHFAMPVFMFMIVVIVVIIMPPAMQTAAVWMTAFVLMRMPGQSVFVITIGIGQPEETTLTNPGSADAGVVTFGESARHMILFPSADLVIIRIPGGAFHMQRKLIAQPRCSTHCTGALAGDRIAPQGNKTFHRLLRQTLGNLVVQHIDHAADSTTAVQQGGRTAQHFYFVSQQRISRYRVIRRNVRGIQQTGTVRQHLHPWRSLPTHHRPARAATKSIGVHTRKTVEQLAQSRAAALGNLLIIKNAVRRYDFICILIYCQRSDVDNWHGIFVTDIRLRHDGRRGEDATTQNDLNSRCQGALR